MVCEQADNCQSSAASADKADVVPVIAYTKFVVPAALVIDRIPIVS
jgi:hypothetical protein